jgi:hypothetical protein
MTKAARASKTPNARLLSASLAALHEAYGPFQQEPAPRVDGRRTIMHSRGDLGVVATLGACFRT